MEPLTYPVSSSEVPHHPHIQILISSSNHQLVIHRFVRLNSSLLVFMFKQGILSSTLWNLAFRNTSPYSPCTHCPQKRNYRTCPIPPLRSSSWEKFSRHQRSRYSKQLKDFRGPSTAASWTRKTLLRMSKPLVFHSNEPFHEPASTSTHIKKGQGKGSDVTSASLTWKRRNPLRSTPRQI
jgi:hypothetical protein